MFWLSHGERWGSLSKDSGAFVEPWECCETFDRVQGAIMSQMLVGKQRLAVGKILCLASFRAFFRFSGCCLDLGCSVCCQFQHLVSTGAVLGNAHRPVATPCRRRSDDDNCKDNFAAFTVKRRLKSIWLQRHHDSKKHQEAMRFLEGHITEDD